MSAVLGAVLGCGSAPPPPAVIADAPPVPVEIDRGPVSMESEIGGLNEEAMDKAFATLEVQHCLEEGAAKHHELGGAFKLKLRIDKEGGARWAYLSESTIGDRETETCVLELARAKNWPRPLGGEGLAEKAFAVDANAAPIELEEKRVRADLAKARAAAEKCRGEVRGSFFATIYVRPDGQVSAAGVAPPDERGEGVADCVVDAIRKVHFRGAGKAAKLSFEIR